MDHHRARATSVFSSSTLPRHQWHLIAHPFAPPPRPAPAWFALTYRVIDGDTLTLDIELPRSEMVEKMRLRGIDCPELNTAEGRAAKRFVGRLMVDAEEITVVTSKVDKYDRYLADVYLRLRSGEEVYLNNALLAAGHAVRMDATSQGDWTP